MYTMYLYHTPHHSLLLLFLLNPFSPTHILLCSGLSCGACVVHVWCMCALLSLITIAGMGMVGVIY